jgi:hypothetical protein
MRFLLLRYAQLRVPKSLWLSKDEASTTRGYTFHVDNREISHSSPEIFYCDTVTITFKYQKNGELMQRRTAWRTNDLILCLHAFVTRILSYPGCDKKRP